MKTVEYLKLLLLTYGFSEDIEISSETKSVGNIYYEVHATNPNTDEHIFEFGNGFNYILAAICRFMYDHKCMPTFAFIDYSVKSCLNDEIRNEIIESQERQKIKIKKHIEKTKWISDLSSEYSPCNDCKLNDHTHWDDMHFNCEKNHNNSCEYLSAHLDCITKLYALDKNSEEANNISLKIKENFKKTH